MVGTWLTISLTSNGLGAPYDCAGYYGPTCGNPSPHWRHQARATFTGPDLWMVSLQWRYVGPVDIEYLNPSATLTGKAYDFGSHINGQSYFDLALSKQMASKGLGAHLLLRVGANNLFDQKPPTTPNYTGSNGYPRPVGGNQVFNLPYLFAPWGVNGGYYYGKITYSF